ncbi:MAG: 50S ribosomal protein L6, partial [Nitrospira sp.]|nr:50S ribosomal protein L6 [Nitrospira sp.]
MQVIDRNVFVKGPLGQLQWDLSPGIEASVEKEEVSLSRNDDSAKLKALHGLTRAELANQLKGVKDGFKENLEVMGVGYRAQIQGNELSFSVGYAHPVSIKLPKGV